MKERFGEILEGIFTNIFKLYRKYFVHWTITRLLIFLFTFCFVLVFILVPMAIFLFKYIGIEKIQEYIQYFQKYAADTQTGIQTTKAAMPIFPSLSLGVIVSSIILGISSFICAVLGIGYANSILVPKAYMGYIKNEPLGYGNNLYFSWSHIKKYLSLSFCQFGIYIGLFLGYFLLVMMVTLILGLISGKSVSISGAQSFVGIISSVSVVLMFFLMFVMFYISIRLSFSNFILATSDNADLSAFEYIKQSWKMTKNRAGWIFLIGLISGIAISIGSGMISGILEYIPYIGYILSYLATGYVTSMVYVSLFCSVKELDVPIDPVSQTVQLDTIS